MKNKFDHMKKLWKDWNELKHGETGLGWDSKKGTIRANPDWWDNKIKENSDMKKFRKKGIPPEIEEKWDCLFGSIVATGIRCASRSMDPNAPRRLEQEDDDEDDDDDEYESHSDDEYDKLFVIDLEQKDPAILWDVIKEVSAPLSNSTTQTKKKG